MARSAGVTLSAHASGLSRAGTMSVAGPVPMSGVPLGSASGLLSMLEEEQTQLQVAALTSLNKVIDTHWAEVASSISVIEAMYEDEFFVQRELAALLASKVRREHSSNPKSQPVNSFHQGLAVCPQEPDLRSVSLPLAGLLPPWRTGRRAELRVVRGFSV